MSLSTSNLAAVPHLCASRRQVDLEGVLVLAVELARVVPACECVSVCVRVCACVCVVAYVCARVLARDPKL